MNSLAVSDAVLAFASLSLASARRGRADLVLAALVLVAAAGLGVLRFAGWCPLPETHRAFSLLAGGLSVPLIAADAALVPLPPLVSRRGGVLVGALVAVAALSFAYAPLAFVQRAVSVGSVVALLLVGARRRNRHAVLVGALFLAAFVGFAAKLSIGVLQPGDLLHLGMALAVVLVASRR